MPSLFEPAVQTDLLNRLSRLTPDATAKWGKFTPVQMVAHLNDSFRMATGELAVNAKPGAFLRNPIVRWFIIHVAPFPKSAPTAPELLARGHGSGVALDGERTRFKEELAKVSARIGTASWPDHPAFGSMTERDWGVLGAKHIDHHFKQFGI